MDNDGKFRIRMLLLADDQYISLDDVIVSLAAVLADEIGPEALLKGLHRLRDLGTEDQRMLGDLDNENGNGPVLQ